jgi:hypothetical protein
MSVYTARFYLYSAVLICSQLLRGVSLGVTTWQSPAVSNWTDLYRRECGVGRALGVGGILGVGVTRGVAVGVVVGVAGAVGVGVGVDPLCEQYLPPVLKKRWWVLLYPPQTIISLPVHTAKFNA